MHRQISKEVVNFGTNFSNFSDEMEVSFDVPSVVFFVKLDAKCISPGG